MGDRNIKIAVIGRDGRGWSVDQDRANTEHLLEGFGFELTKNIFSASHILCVWLDLLTKPAFLLVLVIRKFFHKKLIAVVTNDITNNPEKIPFIKKHVDVCIAPSKRVKTFLESYGITTVRVPFYVSPDVFHKSNRSKNDLATELGIDQSLLAGKIVIGSFQRDSLGTDLSAAKWQKNPELLIEIAKRLPQDRFVLLLAGPRRHYIVNRCRQEHIPYIYYGDESYIDRMKDDYPKNTLSLETINKLYNLSDLYIVSSKSEGGPKAVLEASLTNTLIFSTDVGLAPDMLHSDLIFNMNDPEDAAKRIRSFLENPGSYKPLIEYNREKVETELDLARLREQYQKVFSV